MKVLKRSSLCKVARFKMKKRSTTPLLVSVSMVIFAIGTLTKVQPVGAFWQAAASSSEVQFTTGDWRPPAVKVYLDQAGQEYLVDELVTSDCSFNQEVTLTPAGLSCTLNLGETDLPQFLSFNYQQTDSNGLLTQPGFKLEAKSSATSFIAFTPGISPATPSSSWRSAWVDLKRLKENLGDTNQVTLKFELVGPSLSDVEPSKVKLKNLTTLALVANLNDQLKLKASEPVTWQIDYQVDSQAKHLKLNDQEATLDFSQLDVGALPDSWQIKAVDKAGNESEVIKPLIYIVDSQSIKANSFQLEKETNDRLSLTFNLEINKLNQVLSWRLREKRGDTWQVYDLVKTVPFLNMRDSLLSVNQERVVFTTKDRVSNQPVCLDALILTHNWQEVICTH